jgi:hypothetical protein
VFSLVPAHRAAPPRGPPSRSGAAGALECGGSTPLSTRRLGAAQVSQHPAGRAEARPLQRCRGTALHRDRGTPPGMDETDFAEAARQTARWCSCVFLFAYGGLRSYVDTVGTESEGRGETHRSIDRVRCRRPALGPRGGTDSRRRLRSAKPAVPDLVPGPADKQPRDFLVVPFVRFLPHPLLGFRESRIGPPRASAIALRRIDRIRSSRTRLRDAPLRSLPPRPAVPPDRLIRQSVPPDHY